MKIRTQRYAQDLRKYYKMPVTQVSLTVVLSLVVMAVFIIFALRPTIISITNLSVMIAESRATLALLDTKVANLQKVAIQMDLLKSSLPILNTAIPNQGAMYAPLSTAVELLAQQTGTTLETESLDATLLFSRLLSPFSPSKNQKVVELPFNVRLVGSYKGVTDFLEKLLSMERIVDVESSVITRESGTQGGAGGVSLSVSGRAYYLAEEGQLEKALFQKGKK